MVWTFSSETETGDFVPPYTVLFLSFRHGFHFSTNLYRYQNVLRYIHWLKVDLKTIWIPIYGKLLNSTMNVYNLELVRNNEIRNYVTHKQDVLSVYCWQVILFDIFFHNADVCIFAKTTALFNYIFIQDKSIVFTVSMKFAINRT